MDEVGVDGCIVDTMGGRDTFHALVLDLSAACDPISDTPPPKSFLLGFNDITLVFILLLTVLSP